MMSSGWLLSAVLALTPLLAAAQSELLPLELPTWRLQWANDGLLRSDDQFTNGFLVQKHSALASRLEATTGTPAFGKRLAAVLLPEDSELRYRESWGFGQNMQTPGDLRERELILDDVPYVGMLAWTNTFVALNDDRFTGVETLFGWTGPAALGESTQKLVHALTGNVDPKGWDNQLASEPIVNFYYGNKRKMLRLPHFDIALTFDAGLGNFFTFGQGALEMRFGRMPDGFAFVPSPIGRGMNFDASMSQPGKKYLYGSLAVKTTRFLLSLQREGNRLRDDDPWIRFNTIRMEDQVSQLILGAHIERPRWGVHLNIWFSTDTIVDSTLSDETDVDNSFGTIAVEWRH